MEMHVKQAKLLSKNLNKLYGLNRFGLGWAEEHMSHPEVPVVEFEGDDVVEVDYERAMTYDPKGLSFPQVAIRLVLASAKMAGAEITPTDFERVRRMAMGPEATDTYLDLDTYHSGFDMHERTRRHKLVIDATKDIVQNVHPNSDATEQLLLEEPLVYGGLRYFGNALHAIPDATRERIGTFSEMMIETSLEKTRTRSLKEMGRLAYQEAVLYGAGVWTETVWAEQSAKAREAMPEYRQWISHAMGSLLLVSAGLDLNRDRNSGAVSVAPASMVRAQASCVFKGLANADRVVAETYRLFTGKMDKTSAR